MHSTSNRIWLSLKTVCIISHEANACSSFSISSLVYSSLFICSFASASCSRRTANSEFLILITSRYLFLSPCVVLNPIIAWSISSFTRSIFFWIAYASKIFSFPAIAYDKFDLISSNTSSRQVAALQSPLQIAWWILPSSTVIESWHIRVPCSIRLIHRQTIFFCPLIIHVFRL